MPLRPSFIDALSDAHYARLCRTLILTGNIRDLFAVGDEDAPAFVTLDVALQQSLARATYPRRGSQERFVVVTVKSNGPSLPSAEDTAYLTNLCTVLSNAPRTSELSSFGRALAALLSQIETGHPAAADAVSTVGNLLRIVAGLRQRNVGVRPLTVIFDHANAIFPNVEMGRLSAVDRAVLTTFFDLMRDPELWADADTADTRPDFVILLSATLQEISPGILQLPKTIHIDIPLPDEPARRTFVTRKIAACPISFDYPGTDDPAAALVQDSRGLSISTLDDVITRANRGGHSVSRQSIVAEVNRELQAKLGNVIKIVYPDHGWDDVVGFRKLKQRLARLKHRIDNPERAPAGMTMIGPNGSGKTFIGEAFAAETGRVAITLSQVRSQWFGHTDVLTEMFESAISVFGRIVVLVDEAHVAFGSIHDPNTHETEARLTGRIIQMMDNERNRGNIFWALMTTRPDLLDPDIVRRGRCSLFVPIFDPEGDDAEDFLTWMVRRLARAGVALADDDIALLRAGARGFSAGDYREFIGDFMDEREFDPGVTVASFLTSWTPSAVSLAAEREFQTLLAALRCDWRELMPARFTDLSREAIQDQIDRRSRLLN